MTVEELVRACNLCVFHMDDRSAPVTGGYAGDLLSWVMGRAKAGDAWLTIMSNQNVAAVALLSELSCVVLTEGAVPDRDLQARARERGINLLGSKEDTFTLAARLGALLSLTGGRSVK